MKRPAALIGLVLSLALLVAPAGASASSAECDTQNLSRPFVPWLDFANYTMPDGASFESGATGWRLSGGASVVAGNEPFAVHGAADVSSLRLPPGSSAESTPICIGLGHPILRMFARSSTSLTLSTLRVDVRFRDFSGTQRSLPVGVVLPGARWQPTLPMPVIANLLSLLPSGPSQVTIGLTPMGSATWWIDDLYVDPKARN